MSGQDTAISHAVIGVRSHLEELIGGLEETAVLGAAITNNDL
jgi:hypothetical protein